LASCHGPCPEYNVEEIYQLIETNIKAKTKL
jgi:hypothetical protein